MPAASEWGSTLNDWTNWQSNGKRRVYQWFLLELDLGRVLLEDRHVSTRVFPHGSFPWRRPGRSEARDRSETRFDWDTAKPVSGYRLVLVRDHWPGWPGWPGSIRLRFVNGARLDSFEFLELGLVSSLPFESMPMPLACFSRHCFVSHVLFCFLMLFTCHLFAYWNPLRYH